MSALLSLSPKYELEDWQKRAISAFGRSEHPERGPRHGIFDIFTGAGKTVLALAAMIDAARDVPDLAFAIVVPTKALLILQERGPRMVGWPRSLGGTSGRRKTTASTRSTRTVRGSDC